MSARRCRILSGLLSLGFLGGCDTGGGKAVDGRVLDEAMSANPPVLPSFFKDKFAAEDFFHDMDQTRDGPLTLDQSQIQGRNMWIVWTGGNDRLWDVLNWKSYGVFDLLKTISSYHGPDPNHFANPQLTRSKRWQYLGVANEPCFREATEPDKAHFGLWLDQRIAGCGQEDPFAREDRYPGVRFLQRGKKFQDGTTFSAGSFYGEPTGIVGLRLFPNPYFDDKAKKAWGDGQAYYTNPSFLTKDLVRPYRVGMSCAFCHVGPNPLKPPADPESPQWENLSSNVGAQYFWFNRIFGWRADPSDFIYQLLSTYRPGALDTSLVSTDYIDNPRTMNAVYYLAPRVQHSLRWGHETLSGGGLLNKQFDYNSDLSVFFEPPAGVWTPRVLKDGADSVGVLGALNRVYLNIGLYSEEWLRHFNALFGGQKTSPIPIADARKNSTYWNVTESWTPNMADFFLHSTEPHRLADAPGGKAYLTADPTVLARGKVVFAERCARCHSSKAPAPVRGVDPGGCSGPDYLDCWSRYWAWTKTEDYKSRMREIVMKPDFLDQNFLSSEFRVPVTLLETNACSPLASNAVRDSIWDNFSSETYKNLPSVGDITIYHPVTGEPQTFHMPAGGRGYTRAPSLVSLWSTAPFLLNNSVGKFNSSPSVEARMNSFEDSIEQMLWPEKRERDSDPIVRARVNGPSKIDRTTAKSWIKVPYAFLPNPLAAFVEFDRILLPWAKDSEGLKIGPIPQGTPVGLIANVDLDPARFKDNFGRLGDLAKLLARVKSDLKRAQDLPDDQLKKNYADVTDVLLRLSTCPDLIVNRGHYFGTGMLPESEHEPGLADTDKRALIEFLKTF